jgi:hypothetical protein
MITVYSCDDCPNIKLSNNSVVYWNETEIGLYE